MSETGTSEIGAPPASQDPAHPDPAHSDRARDAAWGVLAAVVALTAAALAWQQHEILVLQARLIMTQAMLARPPALPAPALSAADAARLASLQTGMDALRVRLAAALADQVARRDPRPMPGPDLAPLEQRLARLEQRADSSAPPDLSSLNARIAAIAAAAQKAVRWQQAALALQDGRKLGPLPDAPAALGRFESEAPPTEAALRLSFPAAAAAALRASRPPDAAMSFFARALRRIESLVTVRDGDRVIIGAPASVTLERARGQLDAGDLAGVLRTLGALDPAAAAALAAWRGQAQALLDARAALDAAAD